jgi:hypothetical protein
MYMKKTLFGLHLGPGGTRIVIYRRWSSKNGTACYPPTPEGYMVVSLATGHICRRSYAGPQLVIDLEALVRTLKNMKTFKITSVFFGKARGQRRLGHGRPRCFKGIVFS